MTDWQFLASEDTGMVLVVGVKDGEFSGSNDVYKTILE